MAPIVALRVPGRAEAFRSEITRHGYDHFRRRSVQTLQINVGRLCNQACHHCHVEAGPKRTELMEQDVAERVIELVDASPEITTVDITGGAPELNVHFRYLVSSARALDRHVIDRCNLTVLFEPGMDDLAEFLAAQHVHVIASLPCYTADNVDQQRGKGVFDKSIAALIQLNRLGYGAESSGLVLDLVYNPVGAFLPPAQSTLEPQYKSELADHFGVQFNSLLTLTNLPVKRFADDLARQGKYAEYMELLRTNFNPATVPDLMCRSMVSIGYRGQIFDCDFNQMLEIPLGDRPTTIWDIDTVDDVSERHIATGEHCFGCTAGAGSSCGGALA